MSNQGEERVSNLSDYELPFGRTINLKKVEYETGLKMLRLTIKEGRRFTVIEIDQQSAESLGNDFLNWSKK